MSEPIPLEVTRYICPHCRRGHSKKLACSAHISRCFKNPENRSCKTCAYHERALPDIGYAPAEPEACARGNGEAIPKGCDLWERKMPEGA